MEAAAVIDPIPTWSTEQIPFENPLIESEILTLFGAQDETTVFTTPAYYLHGIRNGNIDKLTLAHPQIAERFRQCYAEKCSEMVDLLVEALTNRKLENAIGVCPPSSRSDARPYLEAALTAKIVGADISSMLRRVSPGFRAGLAKNWESVRRSIVADPAPPIDADILVIFDDVLASGRSAAATALALRAANVLPGVKRTIVVAPLQVASNRIA